MGDSVGCHGRAQGQRTSAESSRPVSFRIENIWYRPRQFSRMIPFCRGRSHFKVTFKDGSSREVFLSVPSLNQTLLPPPTDARCPAP